MTDVPRRRVFLPLARPIDRIRVPAWPTARQPSYEATGKQVTVIDHDEDGEPFIRSYVERYAMRPDDPYYQHARHTVTVYCVRKLEFSVALTACHHYCRRPCPEHLARLAEQGWSTPRCPPPSQVRDEPAKGKRKKQESDDD